jgi:hypothetical protein
MKPHAHEEGPVAEVLAESEHRDRGERSIPGDRRSVRPAAPRSIGYFRRRGSGVRGSHTLLHPRDAAKRVELAPEPSRQPRRLPFYEYRRRHPGWRPRITATYLDEVAGLPGDHQAVGFKLMYDQLALFPEST